MGGTRIVNILNKYYSGKMIKNRKNENFHTNTDSIDINHNDKIIDLGLNYDSADLICVKLKEQMPSLLSALSKRINEHIHYIGVSMGLKQDIFNFWDRNGFKPVYLCQSKTNFTGEHTIILISILEDSML